MYLGTVNHQEASPETSKLAQVDRDDRRLIERETLRGGGGEYDQAEQIGGMRPRC